MIVGLVVVQASAQAPLTENEIIELARERGAGAAVAAATESLAGARERAAGRLPNPTLQWGRETVSAETVFLTQDIVTANMPLRIAAPLAERSLAAADASRMRARASVSRSDAVVGALVSYYEAVAARAHEALLAEAIANLEEAGRVLERREQEGTASGYETSRLRVATELVRSERALLGGHRRAAEARLARALDLPSRELQVPTTLDLTLADVTAARAHLGASRPAALEHAMRAIEHAETAADRARWGWVPTLDVSLGVKQVNEFGGAVGYVVGLGLDVPVSDRGQDVRAEADAGRALAVAQAQKLRRELEADAQAALAEYESIYEELARFETSVGEDVQTLLRAAQGGYREGHHTLLELLDAQRSATEVARRVLSLRLAVKRAEARLRAASGDFQ